MRWRLPVLLFVSSALLAQQEPAAAPSGYAGSETCGICHEEIARSLPRGPHRLIETVQGGKWRGSECESCHGAGAEHSESTEVAQILGFKTQSANQINQACLACHAGNETHSGRLFGSHNRNQLDCLACHSVHSAAAQPLLVAESGALCASCHVAERAAFNRPFTHRLNQKAIACVDCHNPHGGPPPAGMRRVAANEPTCLNCHTDKRGPFLFEHAPVRLEPCSSCHEPHGSANPRMLIRHNISQLCLECHTGSMNTLGATPPGFHDLRSARFRNCTVCHSKIHGSYINRDFLR